MISKNIVPSATQTLIVALLPRNSPYAIECATFNELMGNELSAYKPPVVVNWFGVTDVADLLVEPNRQMYAQQWIGAQQEGVQIADDVSPINYVNDNFASCGKSARHLPSFDQMGSFFIAKQNDRSNQPFSICTSTDSSCQSLNPMR